MFLWENLGPSHHDRLRAVANAGYRVTAIELYGKSEDYDWEDPDDSLPYRVVTLARDRHASTPVALALRIVQEVRRSGARSAFFCHYNEPSVFLAALMLRVRGVDVATMLDSKSDDRRRSLATRMALRILVAPYNGALSASPRSTAYIGGLGVPRARIAEKYSTLDIAALRALGDEAGPIAYAERPFLIVARLVEKKNIPLALQAFARYRLEHGGQRRLSVMGDGPEGPKYRQFAAELEIADFVDWHGAKLRAEVAVAMRRALALILPSTVEQFGLVINEALAQGLPPLVSAHAGAVDVLVDDGFNGLVFDPRDRQALVVAMLRLDRDETYYAKMAEAAWASAAEGDIRHFVSSVETLLR